MNDYPITAVPFTAVTLADRFWLPRLETNRTVTIPDVSFAAARSSAGWTTSARPPAGWRGQYRGKMPFEDTDVYKAVEGASLLPCPGTPTRRWRGSWRRPSR